MAKTIFPSIRQIREDFSELSFAPHEVFHWSPRKNTVFYDPQKITKPSGIYQLLHEVGHALSKHCYYESGVHLIRIESEAWHKAQVLAEKYGLVIDQDHIESSLDSYRDWLHLRSTCPQCQSVSLETKLNHYHCFNCMQKWKVPSDQRSRYYRRKIDFGDLNTKMSAI